MIKAGYRYKVKYVDHRQTKDGKDFTIFRIGHKIKSSDPDKNAGFWNLRAIVWEYVDVADGEEVFIKSIKSVAAKEHGGKVYYEMQIELDSEAKGKDEYDGEPSYWGTD
jgi:hypothetical protein